MFTRKLCDEYTHVFPEPAYHPCSRWERFPNGLMFWQGELFGWFRCRM